MGTESGRDRGSEGRTPAPGALLRATPSGPGPLNIRARRPANLIVSRAEKTADDPCGRDRSSRRPAPKEKRPRKLPAKGTKGEAPLRKAGHAPRHRGSRTQPKGKSPAPWKARTDRWPAPSGRVPVKISQVPDRGGGRATDHPPGWPARRTPSAGMPGRPCERDEPRKRQGAEADRKNRLGEAHNRSNALHLRAGGQDGALRRAKRHAGPESGRNPPGTPATAAPPRCVFDVSHMGQADCAGRACARRSRPWSPGDLQAPGGSGRMPATPC